MGDVVVGEAPQVALVLVTQPIDEGDGVALEGFDFVPSLDVLICCG